MKNDDVELVKRIVAGDESALEILVRKYQEQVHYKAPDPEIINFARLFTNPAIIAILRELVDGEKSVSDLVEATGMPESDIENGVKTLGDATLLVRTDENLIKPNNDVMSFFLNFVSMTIVHLGHIKSEDR